MTKETLVFKTEAKWGRSATLKLIDNKVVFDCSDEEYGPIEFDISLLQSALWKHIEDDSDWDVTLLDGLDDL